jgi:hypothetical protein
MIDEGNLIGWRARERAHDEVEIRGRKPGPTIRPDHRELTMRDQRAYGKPEIFSHRSTQIFTDNQETRNRGAGRDEMHGTAAK